jgi:hypothetical protein
MTNKISNSKINILWNIHNTIFDMLVIDEIIQCPRVYIHLQTNTAASVNANGSPMFIIFIHTYAWIGVPPFCMGCCYNNKMKWLNRKVKNNKNNYDGGTNHLWGLLVSIQMQYQFLIKLLNKKKNKIIKIKKNIYFSYWKNQNYLYKYITIY